MENKNKFKDRNILRIIHFIRDQVLDGYNYRFLFEDDSIECNASELIMQGLRGLILDRMNEGENYLDCRGLGIYHGDFEVLEVQWS